MKPTNSLIVILLLIIIAIFTASELVYAQGQFFLDETSTRLPAIEDRTFDADFGDIDGDGDFDVFVSNSGSSSYPNLIYINSGTGYFTEETEDRMSQIYDNTTDSELGDVDRDEDLDLIVANYTTVAEDYMDLFLNNGIGYFTENSAWLPPRSVSFLSGIDLGDVEGDLDLDIVAANYGSNRLFLNLFLQGYSIASEDRFPRGSDNSNDVVFSDVDNDFDIDVFIANNTGGKNRLLINDGTGYFTDETDERIPTDTEQSNGESLVDIDGDGDIDIFVANGFFPGRNKLWINDGEGYFIDESEDRMPIYGEVSLDASYGDIDNDGDFDLIIANFASQSGGLSTRVFINDGTGHFTDETDKRYPVIEEDTADIAVSDVDGDGDVDLYIGNYGEYPAQEQNRLLINTSTPDSFPPIIPRTYHHPDTGDTTDPYLITTTVWDNISVAIGELKVSLFYRSMSEINDADFTEIPMLDCGGFLNRENIPAQSSVSTVEYYIKAEDRMGNFSFDPPNAPDSVFSFLVDVNVSIGDDPPSSSSLPKTFSLSQNYPNPFNPSTTIDYSIPEGETEQLQLLIYDLRGRLIRALINEEKSPGSYSVHWDGRSNDGREVGSGVYLYRIESGSFTSTRKMTILR